MACASQIERRVPDERRVGAPVARQTRPVTGTGTRFRWYSIAVEVLGLTRSVLRGRRDAVDDEDLHRSARGFEPQAQLLANRDSQRGQV